MAKESTDSTVLPWMSMLDGCGPEPKLYTSSVLAQAVFKPSKNVAQIKLVLDRYGQFWRCMIHDMEGKISPI